MLRWTEGLKPGKMLPQKRKTDRPEVVVRKKSMKTQKEKENVYPLRILKNKFSNTNKTLYFWSSKT